MTNSRFQQTEESTREPEDTKLEIIDIKEQRGKEKRKQSLRNEWDISNQINICIMGVPEVKEGEKGWKKYLNK